MRAIVTSYQNGKGKPLRSMSIKLNNKGRGRIALFFEDAECHYADFCLVRFLP